MILFIIGLAFAALVLKIVLARSHKPQQGTKVRKDTWRSKANEKGLDTQIRNCSTLSEVFRSAAQEYKNEPCLGSREVLNEETFEKDGRTFVHQERGQYKWQTYGEVYERACRAGRGLRALGLTEGKNMAIFADSQCDWQVIAQACFRQSIPLATVYASLGDEALVHALNETEVSCLATQRSLLGKVEKLHKSGKLDRVKHIIVIGDEAEGAAKNFASGAKLLTIKELEERGKEGPDELYSYKDDTAVIMYTSGSTGLPKGVVISHANLVAALAGLNSAQLHGGITSNDVYIGYLPLAHVLELAAELTMLSCGARIGYSSPLTLADASPKIKPGTHGDVVELRPTLMAAVPAIMERLRQAVLKKVSNSSPVKRALFKGAFAVKKFFLQQNINFTLFDKIVFGAVRASLGGRVRIMLSGGAPLSGETERFMRICFCCPVGQGYGLTETCGGGTVKLPVDCTTGLVGPPLPCAEIKLRSWKEGGYTTEDSPYPRGEILIGGNQVTMGYYKNEEKTKEEYITEDGQRWFCTGDIGVMHPNGALQVIDRKKDLVKLQHGEYVSLGKVESELKQCQFVENICVYADSNSDYAVAIVVPKVSELESLASQIGVNGSIDELCQNAEVVDQVTKKIEEAGKIQKLSKFEIPKRIFLTSKEWTPESDLVTAALKLKRKNIEKFYKDEIKNMYK